MKEIKLFNRDGANLKLVSEDSKLWKFQVDDKHSWVLEYMRMGFENDNKTISFIDPSGGPYLSRGQRLDNDYIIQGFLEVDDRFVILTEKRSI